MKDKEVYSMDEKEKQTKSRLQRQVNTKKKKYNQYLNLSIVLVFMLILIIGIQIVLQKDTASNKTNETKVETNTTKEEKQEPSSKQTIEKDKKEQADKKQEEEEKKETEEEAEEPGEFQPIGTSQSEPHVTQFDKNSVDWSEMEKAMSYATEIPGDQMVTWWVKNGGAPDRVIGYVSTRETQNTPYEVSLVWVPEKGWKPESVQLLESNPFTK